MTLVREEGISLLVTLSFHKGVGFCCCVFCFICLYGMVEKIVGHSWGGLNLLKSEFCKIWGMDKDLSNFA